MGRWTVRDPAVNPLKAGFGVNPGEWETFSERGLALARGPGGRLAKSRCERQRGEGGS